MASADKSSSPEPLKREAGGGCPPSSCSYPSTRYNSPNVDYSSTASSCCSSQCRYPSSHRTFDCQPCALKSILKKRNCYQSNTSSYCLCQPVPRGCNCPPPIQVDARATHECSCDCPSSPECACPPSERRFPKATIKCPNAHVCCPSFRLPPGPKYYCSCQPRCPPPPCNPCTSFKCRRPVSTKDSCQPNSPCPSCPPCRPISTTSSYCPPTPCRKLTFCTERNERLSSPCTGQSWCEITGDKNSESSICNEQNDDKARETYVKKDSNYCYAMDRAESEDKSKYADQSRNLILDEESIQNSTSKTFINLTETTNPSKSVDPDSCDVPEQRDEIAFENTTKAFEACTTEKSSKDSWYTPCTHIPFDSGTKSDCCAFRKEYPVAGGNVSGNPVLVRLLSRMKPFNRVRNLLTSNKTLRHNVTFRDVPIGARIRLVDASISKSNPTTASTHGIDRRHRNDGSLKEDTSSLPREN